MEIIYKPGTLNVSADALSCRPYDPCTEDSALVHDDSTNGLPVASISDTIAELPSKEWVETTIEWTHNSGENISNTLPVNAVEVNELAETDDSVSLDISTKPNIVQLQRECEDFAPIFEYLDSLPVMTKRQKW